MYKNKTQFKPSYEGRKHKKLFAITNIFLCFFLLIFITNFVSAVKPISSITITEGYNIEPTEKSAIMLNQPHAFEVHVFNVSNGLPIISGITCYLHLYHEDGEHIYEGVQSTPNHIFDYGFDLSAGNFSKRGEYEAKFQCNSSTLGGSSQLFFIVNNLGEELNTAHSIKFNSAMFFMMILFLCSLFGIFYIESYIGKFALYWVCHVLFVVGTFSVWKFNMGYTTSFTGLAGIWKVLFYVSTIAVFPMIILSLAWIFYIHTVNEDMKKYMDRGMDENEAYDRSKKGRK